MNSSKRIKTDLDSILGSGMKDLINSVDDNLPVTSVPEPPVESDVFTVSGNRFEENLKYFLNVKTEKRPIYVDQDVLKQLDDLQHKLRYEMKTNKFVPLGGLVSAIIKTFFDARTHHEE